MAGDLAVAAVPPPDESAPSPDARSALLRVEGASSEGRALPDPMSLASAEPEDLLDRDVYVVGYPALDSRRNEPAPVRRIFADIYDVKRLQPGKAVGYSTRYSAVERSCERATSASPRMTEMGVRSS